MLIIFAILTLQSVSWFQIQNKKGKKKVHTRAGSLLRSKSYQKSFDFAVTEAESFRKLTNEMRLEKCVYIPKTMSLEAKKKEAKPLQKDEFNQTKLDTGKAVVWFL